MDSTQPQRILLVEDEQKILKLLRIYLESVGYDVHGETHGLPAIRYATEHRPDLVILDLRLPDIDGHEVCDELRRIYDAGELPIMMLTAMDTPNDKALGLERGADVYVTKPFDPPALLPTISTLLNKIDPERGLIR